MQTLCLKAEHLRNNHCPGRPQSYQAALSLVAQRKLGAYSVGDIYALCGYPSARPDGLGAMGQTQTHPGVLRDSTIITIGLALLMAWAARRGGAGAGLACGALACALVDTDLGGLTGDTYGALCDIGEVIALAALTARV
jgi:adenosylcobinamide-GDP ribazoletransferase